MTEKLELIETKMDGKPKYFEKNIKEGFKEIQDNQKITDGYHTFEELYDHRCELFAFICNSQGERAWKSKLHDDGTMFDNYFIVGIETPEGQFTYHYHLDKWDLFKVKELTKAPEWDGHEAKDVTRLRSLVEENPPTVHVSSIIESVARKFLKKTNGNSQLIYDALKEVFDGTEFLISKVSVTHTHRRRLDSLLDCRIIGTINDKEIIIEVRA